MLTLGYSAIVGSKPDEAPVLRRAGHEAKLVDHLEGATIISDVFELGIKRVGPNAPCFGTRFRADGSVGPFVWQNYGQVGARIAHFALGIQSMQLVPPAPTAETLRALGFFARNSAEWVIGALACYRLGIVVVPMYDTLGPDVVEFIASQTGASTILCYPSGLKTVLAAGARAGGPLRTAIVLEPVSAAQRADAAAAGVTLHLFTDVEARGAAGLARAHGAPADSLLPRKPPPESLALLCYTSGTTGEPKGAMLTHRSILASVASATLVGLGEPPDGQTDWYLSYLPLAHIFETAGARPRTQATHPGPLPPTNSGPLPPLDGRVARPRSEPLPRARVASVSCTGAQEQMAAAGARLRRAPLARPAASRLPLLAAHAARARRAASSLPPSLPTARALPASPRGQHLERLRHRLLARRHAQTRRRHYRASANSLHLGTAPLLAHPRQDRLGRRRQGRAGEGALRARARLEARSARRDGRAQPCNLGPARLRKGAPAAPKQPSARPRPPAPRARVRGARALSAPRGTTRVLLTRADAPSRCDHRLPPRCALRSASTAAG